MAAPVAEQVVAVSTQPGFSGPTVLILCRRRCFIEEREREKANMRERISEVENVVFTPGQSPAW